MENKSLFTQPTQLLIEIIEARQLFSASIQYEREKKKNHTQYTRTQRVPRSYFPSIEICARVSKRIGCVLLDIITFCGRLPFRSIHALNVVMDFKHRWMNTSDEK